MVLVFFNDLSQRCLSVKTAIYISKDGHMVRTDDRVHVRARDSSPVLKLLYSSMGDSEFS